MAPPSEPGFGAARTRSVAPVATLAPKAARSALEIRVRPLLEPPRVQVEIRAQGAPSELGAWALSREGVQDLELGDDGGPLPLLFSAVAGESRIRARRKPRGDVRVRYSISAETLDKAGFRADGASFLFLPVAYRARAISVFIRIDPRALGPEARVASSFGIGSELKLDASGDALIGATFVAGSLGHAVFDGPEGIDRAAWLGTTAFDPRQVAAEVAGFRTGAREYFASRTARPFTLLVLGDSRPVGEFSASRRTASVLVQVGATQQWTGALRLATAQQVLREWMGAELAVKPASGDPLESAWLSDGVSRSLARELLFRFGLLTPEEYRQEVEQLLALHVTSPVLRVPLAELPKHLDRHSAEIAVVVRGALFASLLDARIRGRWKGARSIDDLLRELFAAARATGGPLPPEAVTHALEKQLGEETARELEARFLRGTETITLPGHALGRCFAAKVTNHPIFSLGFSPRSGESGGTLAAEVDPKGPAARAGLKSGDQILGLRFRRGRSDVPVALSVKRDAAWKPLSYLPVSGSARGQGFVRVPGVKDEICALRGKP